MRWLSTLHLKERNRKKEFCTDSRVWIEVKVFGDQISTEYSNWDLTKE